MAITPLLNELWQLRDQHRGRLRSDDPEMTSLLVGHVHEFLDREGETFGPKDLAAILRIVAVEEQRRPEHLIRFLAEYAAQRKAMRVLDPFAGVPEIAASVAVQTRGSVAAYTPYSDLATLANRFGSQVDWRATRTVDELPVFDGHFDLLVSSPPIGIAGPPHVEIPVPGLRRSDMAKILIANAAEAVDEIAFVTTDQLWWGKDGEAFRSYLSELKFSPWASINVPNGLGNISSIPVSIVIFRKVDAGDLFIAQLTSATDIAALVEGVDQHRASPVVELGSLVDSGAYRGWDSAQSQLRFEQLSKRSPIPHVPLAEVATEFRVQKLAPGMDFEAPPNSLFFDSRILGRARTTLEPPRKAEVRWHEAVVDPDRADATFLAHWLNETEIGGLAQRRLAQGSAQQRIPRDEVGQVMIPDLPVSEQREVMKLRNWLVAVRDEADSLATGLIAESWQRREVELEARSLAEVDPVSGWADRLPFVLGSIVHRYRIETDPARKLYNALHLLEATAIVLAAALLVAVSGSPETMTKVGE
ncbi:MAG: hypothetical protein KDC46_04395, partial [Thermoleophilia bacterium]|nr:hypothetical protein [Thermoleophilia bacterium]